MSVELSHSDFLAILQGDSDFINGKGARLYTDGDYENAVEYYRIAAAMGNTHAVSNLGYCYMYGRSIARNQSLAMAYFHLAAGKGDIDAMYKLGNIYERGAEGIAKDQETAVYYYRMAAQAIQEHYDDPVRYPSLYLSLAKAHMPGGLMFCSLKDAYRALQIARRGYELEEAEGVQYHKDAYKTVLQLLDDPCFDSIRDEMVEDDEEFE